MTMEIQMKRLDNLIAILARDVNGVIGINNDLPWKLPSDLKFFKQTTMGGTIIMGRKTYESLPCYPRCLPGRLGVVLTSNTKIPEHLESFADVEDLLEHVETEHLEDFFVIGGGEVYKQLLPYCASIYITEVDTVVETKPDDHVVSVDIDLSEFRKINVVKIDSSETDDQFDFEINWYII